MTTSILYTIITGLVIIIFLIIFQNRRRKSRKYIKRDYTRELNALTAFHSVQSKYNWLVFIKNFNGLKLDYESNDSGEAAYHIYCSYKEQIIQKQMIVYIKNNIENKYLKIVTDEDSESMIGVDHPIHGHIGYLSFEDMSNN